ncbi:MAG: hypothetical protein ACJA0U_003681 [Salibacteraceae bacterium]
MLEKELWFNLHLETEDYYAEDDPEDEDDGDESSLWSKLKRLFN